MIRRTLAPFLGALLFTGFAVGCGDLPVETDLTDGYPVEKLDVENGDITPEVEFHAIELGFSETERGDLLDASAGDRDRGTRAPGRSDDHPVDFRGRNSDHARDDAAAIFRRALASMDLNERQVAAIRDCYADYETCIESARNRARNARQELYEAFRARVERIRNGVADESITRREAHGLMLEAIQAYREAVIRLHRALKAAEADCIASLRDCIESALTREQVARFRELIAQGRGGDDNGGRGDDDHADDNGGDRDGNGRGDHADDNGGDRGGDRGGDDDGGDDDGDDNGGVRNGRGG